MSAPSSQRLRLRYAKTGDARFIGHLDEARFWERVFRRVDLPLAYSHGFNPQAKMQFAAALPVGVEGENEWLDVWTREPVQPDAWLDRIRSALPPGFTLHDLTEIPLTLPAMQASLRMAIYDVRWRQDLGEELATGVDELLACSSLIRPHHKDASKTYDLRPLIASLAILPPDEDASTRLHMALRSGPAGSARVTEVIAALGLEQTSHRIIRTNLILAEPG